MILLTYLRYSPSPNLARTPASQGARARGDRTWIDPAPVCCERAFPPFRSIVTVVGTPDNPIAADDQERATGRRGIGARLVSDRAARMEQGLSSNPSDKRRKGQRDGGSRVVAGTLPNPHAAVTRIVAPNPGPALIPDINHEEVIPMAQRQPEIVEIAEELGELKKLAIRIVWRDGVMDDDEWDFIERTNRIEKRLYTKADDEAFGLAMIRVGRESDRVTRLGRQIFSHDDDAA